MDWNNELLASLVWLAQAFVLSLAGLALAVVALARFTVWGRQFRRITADYFSPRRSALPLGWLAVIVFMTLFFILTAIASVGAILSLLEVPVAVLSERFHMTRKAAAITTIAITAVLGLPAALSQGVTADLKIFGLNPFDLFDFLSSNILLPLGGILICLFVGWVYGLPQLEKQLGNNGNLPNGGLIRAIFFLVRYVTPLLIAVVLLHGLKVF